MILHMNVPKPFLKDREVADLLDIGRSTVWHYVGKKALPRPVKLGKYTRWRRMDIRQWAMKGR